MLEGAFYDGGEFSLAGGGQEAAVPHHVSNGCATLSVGPSIGQFIRITESLAIAACAHSAGDVHLRSDQILPQNAESLPISRIAGFQVIVGCAAARVHGTHGVTFKMRS